jgi:hypothetical protein
VPPGTVLSLTLGAVYRAPGGLSRAQNRAGMLRPALRAVPYPQMRDEPLPCNTRICQARATSAF